MTIIIFAFLVMFFFTGDGKQINNYQDKILHNETPSFCENRDFLSGNNDKSIIKTKEIIEYDKLLSDLYEMVLAIYDLCVLDNFCFNSLENFKTIVELFLEILNKIQTLTILYGLKVVGNTNIIIQNIKISDFCILKSIIYENVAKLNTMFLLQNNNYDSELYISSLIIRILDLQSYLFVENFTIIEAVCFLYESDYGARKNLFDKRIYKSVWGNRDYKEKSVLYNFFSIKLLAPSHDWNIEQFKYANKCFIDMHDRFKRIMYLCTKDFDESGLKLNCLIECINHYKNEALACPDYV